MILLYRYIDYEPLLPKGKEWYKRFILRLAVWAIFFGIYFGLGSLPDADDQGPRGVEKYVVSFVEIFGVMFCAPALLLLIDRKLGKKHKFFRHWIVLKEQKTPGKGKRIIYFRSDVIAEPDIETGKVAPKQQVPQPVQQHDPAAPA